MRVSGCPLVLPRRSSRISVDCMQIAVAATWAPPHSSRTAGKGSSSFLPWQKPAVSLNKTSREEFQPEKRERERKRKRGEEEREKGRGSEREREMAPLVALLHRVVKYTSHQLILIKMRLTLAVLLSFLFASNLSHPLRPPSLPCSISLPCSGLFPHSVFSYLTPLVWRASLSASRLRI